MMIHRLCERKYEPMKASDRWIDPWRGREDRSNIGAPVI